MNWNKLTAAEDLSDAYNLSFDQPVILFKHSTRCPISTMALSWFERSWNPDEVGNTQPYFLDLIAHRDLSNQIASQYGVMHESPQLLLIKNGECVYHKSHSAISFKEVKSKIDTLV
jgi:bacillithiol system protein YtxJ